MDSRRQFLKAFDASPLSFRQQSPECHHFALSALCPILKESITIPATREEITHPWDLKNHAGMAAIIYNQYYKPSFNSNLIKAMSFQISAGDTKTNPMKAVTGVQDLISTCDTHNLWAQMLRAGPFLVCRSTPQSYFSCSNIFRDVLQKTQEFISTHEHDPPSGRLPIFTYSSTYIQNLQSSGKTFNSGKPTSSSDKQP